MFGKKKDGVARKQALSLIKEALEEVTSKFEAGYARGMIDMAYMIDLIDVSERADFVHEIVMREIKAQSMEKPQYRKKGCYEYRGYNILKVEEGGDGAENWAIARVGEELPPDHPILSYKRAIEMIDILTNK